MIECVNCMLKKESNSTNLLYLIHAVTEQLLMPKNDIAHLLLNKLDIDISSLKASYLESVLNKRITETNTKDIESYIKMVEVDQGERRTLHYSLYNDYSHFFRNPLMFEFSARQLLPKLIQQKAENNGLLRMWTAGCASGEESYTVAIILKELFHQMNMEIPTTLIATDIEDRSLEKARQGVYSENAVGNVKHKYLEKYFHKRNNQYHICECIKEMVILEKYDIADKYSYAPPSSIFGSFDIIGCRNVLIYFNEKSRQAAINKFYRALKPDGLLVLGESEFLPDNLTNKFERLNSILSIYRKKNIYEDA
ncbi:protein-glutamate O-methyltransferase CheR [Puteibacter caeruleilacunae]|nr:protein-glutamate O-methyltransferase CheR [Puteibacter caeruleilacunae]